MKISFNTDTETDQTILTGWYIFTTSQLILAINTNTKFAKKLKYKIYVFKKEHGSQDNH